MRLLDTIRCAGWKEVYYHDTDSVHVSARGLDLLGAAGRIGCGELGRLRLVGSHSTADYSGIKHYTLDARVVCAGLPRGTAEHDPQTGGWWVREHIAGSIRRSVRPEAIATLRQYSRTAAYRHGVVRDDGFVDPINLEE